MLWEGTMKDFFKSRFFMILALVLAVMIIVPSIITAMGAGSFVKSALNTVTTPIQKLFNYSADALSGFASYFTEFDRIADENEELRNRIAELNDKVAKAEETEEMNNWLYNYLELKREHPDYKFATADVTGREAGNYMTVFTLDKGSAHGIEKNMPAVTDYGVVGYVTEVGVNWCKVVTLLESGTAVGAYVERTGEVGVVEGDFALSKEGLCKMVYISAGSDIREGDRIFTSGYGSVYPRGLTVGTVKEVVPDPNSQTLIAYIEPAEKMQDIKKLMIITDYEVTLDE